MNETLDMYRIDAMLSRVGGHHAHRKTVSLRGATPYQLLVVGYIVVALAGACLLSLPISSAGGTSQPFVDALFVSTSGLSTTGLCPVDVGSYYSLFGQIVLMTMFQIGGIGYMTIIILIMYFLGMKGSIRTSIVARESLVGSNLHTLRRFFLSVMAYTLFFELAGAIVLAFFWRNDYSAGRAAYLGLFHSISAFCTAGFSLFPDSFMRYQQSITVNTVIVVVSLAGGIGFFVLKDLTAFVTAWLKRRRPRRLAVHTKLVLIVTAAMVGLGTAVIMLSEDWSPSMSRREASTAAVFQAVSASTTDGFNTMDIGAMSPASQTAIMLLMYVGASPGSTGGGIKTTTFALLFIVLWARLRRREVNVLGREISESCVYNAIIVSLCFMLVTFVDALVLSATENASYLQILFETFSALGNTGLSTGITSSLSEAGKIILTLTMFIGRVGILSIAFALLSRPKKVCFRYPKEDVFVG